MNNKDLLKAMGNIDPKLIADAAPNKFDNKIPDRSVPAEHGISISTENVKTRKFPWKIIVSSAACAAAVLFGVFIMKDIIPIDPDNKHNSNSYSANSGFGAGDASNSGSPDSEPNSDSENSAGSDSENSSDSNNENKNENVYDFEDYDISDVEAEILSIKTTEGTIEHTFKKIMLHAATLGEMVDDLQRSKYFDRITEVQFMVGAKSLPSYTYTFKDGEWSFEGQDWDGPIDIEYTDEQIRETDISEKMLIFVRYDEDKWVRYLVSILFDWDAENLWNYTDDFSIAIGQIIKASETIEEMVQAIREIDKYELATDIAVFKSQLDYLKNTGLITEGKLEPGMVIVVYSPKGGYTEYNKLSSDSDDVTPRG
ncbi:MAG: hypothetical protein J1F04_00390 [Oscillospiraceae bacterium]|nr:hypothetical protein [Oscillospiraceae bacterium]